MSGWQRLGQFCEVRCHLISKARCDLCTLAYVADNALRSKVPYGILLF